jgi:hypothetical protein
MVGLLLASIPINIFQKGIFMKTLCLLLFSVIASVSFAWPTVGDTVTYDLTVQQGTQVKSGTLQLSITAIDVAHDQLTLQQESVLTLQHQGVVEKQSETQTKMERLSSFQQVAQAAPTVVATCAQYKGTVETVVTAAGVFPACKITSIDDATKQVVSWYADVLLGSVKQVMTIKATHRIQTEILKTVSFGK